MLTLIIGLVAAFVTGGAMHLWLASTGWTTAAGVAGFMASSGIINFWVRKRLQQIFERVQEQIENDQNILRRRIGQLQVAVAGSTKGIQKRLEQEQAEGIRKAIRELDTRMEGIAKWNFLAQRQANTLRAQLYFQIRDYEQADRYLEKCFIVDPLILAIRMVRLQAAGKNEELEKAFRKGVKRFKGDKATIIYAVYSHFLVRNKEFERAVEVLAQGKKQTDNELVRANWEHLANNRPKQFSFADLGDQWYALQLEPVKAVRVKQRAGRRRRV